MAQCYVDGAWATVQDEFWQAWPESGDMDDALTQTQYELWTRVGDGDALALPLTLSIYSRQQEPRFLVGLDTIVSMEWVYAQKLSDLMDLLGQWMPAVQGAAVSEMIRQFNNPGGQNLDAIDLIRDLLGKN